jgi:hypothetical protein
MVQNNWKVIQRCRFSCLCMGWCYFLVFGVNKWGKRNEVCFPNKNFGSGNWWIVQRIPILVWAKCVIKVCNLRYRGSTASRLWWRNSSPLHPVRCLDRRHSCHMSAFQCASEPAEECKVIFMCLNTVSWLTRFEIWSGQRGFSWLSQSLHANFGIIIWNYSTTLPYNSQCSAVCNICSVANWTTDT